MSNLPFVASFLKFPIIIILFRATLKSSRGLFSLTLSGFVGGMRRLLTLVESDAYCTGFSEIRTVYSQFYGLTHIFVKRQKRKRINFYITFKECKYKRIVIMKYFIALK